MVTVVYYNGTVDRFPVISQAQSQAMADELADQMGTQVKSIHWQGMQY